MSEPIGLPSRKRLAVHRRVAPLLAVAVARVLSRLKPRHLGMVLRAVRPGAKPATAEQALAAREAVVSVSLRCASGKGCLPRSIATVVLCRLRGRWATWCTGIRTEPFTAHAWVEAEGGPVGEPYPAGYFTPLLTVPVRTNDG